MDLPPPKELHRLEDQVDAMTEAAKSCATPSNMELIQGRTGNAPADYRCPLISSRGK